MRPWVAGARAHLKEAAGGAGVQCSGGGDGRSGGRSSAGCGDAAAVRWESNWRWRWLPAELLSMVTRADAGCGGSDHGGAMAGGGGLSGSMGTTTMRRNRARGERGTKEELTAGQTSGSVASGEAWRRRATMAISGGHAEKKSSMTRLQGIRGRVVRRRGARQRGGARGRDGWPWGGRW